MSVSDDLNVITIKEFVDQGGIEAVDKAGNKLINDEDGDAHEISVAPDGTGWIAASDPGLGSVVKWYDKKWNTLPGLTNANNELTSRKLYNAK